MRKGTTAISAGALALALGGGTTLLVATPAAASPARVADCSRDGRLLSSLTGGACDLLGGVTDAVDHITGDSLKPVTDTVDTTAHQVLGGASQPPATDLAAGSAPKTSPGPPSEASGHGDGGADLLGLPLDTSCLPLLAPDCGGAGTSPAPRGPSGRDRSNPAPAPKTPAPREAASRPPAVPPAQEDTLTGGAGPGGGVERAITSTQPTAPPRADVETPPLTWLWPGQPVPVLAGRLEARKIAPSRPYDAAGTTLTAVLLASAILAARIVQARRNEDEPQSMPFEGLRRPDAGRHRLA
ncbi:MAG: hypothetical protein JWQ95_1701 [Sphaerisporangium sp.]|nr:hypothetical protein [Sphaerisporangium sp.]